MIVSLKITAFGPYAKQTELNFKEDLKIRDLPILKDTMYHTIKGDDVYILIELK